jgi:hypothetical protein
MRIENDRTQDFEKVNLVVSKQCNFHILQNN